MSSIQCCQRRFHFIHVLCHGSFFDWKLYDTDGFGILNQLGIITSGYPAELGDPNKTLCPNENKAINRLWSIGSSASGTTWQSKDFYTFATYFFSGGLHTPFCNDTPATMNQFTHEYLHGFGLLDMYDTDTNGDDPILAGGTGAYDIMAYSWGWNSDGALIPHMTPMDRNSIGWIETIEIIEDGLYAIMASEVSGQVYRISKLYPDGMEYFIIENRQPMKWDINMKPGGIVIYHIDLFKQNGNDQRGYPGHRNWPSEHYQYAVQQADGNYDIEKDINLGDAKDFWINGMIFGPGDRLNSITIIYPNTDSYITGRTGLMITITSPSRFIMTFNVTGLGSSSTTIRRKSNTTRVAARDPPSTKSNIKWILSMFIGSAALIGLVVLFLV